MASSEPRVEPAGDGLPYPDEPEHVATPFEQRARLYGAVHGLLACGFVFSLIEAVRDGGLDAPAWWQTLIVLAGLPTTPLFAALPLPTWAVGVAAIATSLPVWAWAGAALARKVEPRHGADWIRWARRWPLLPLGGLAMAFVFVGGLTPMGS